MLSPIEKFHNNKVNNQKVDHKNHKKEKRNMNKNKVFHKTLRLLGVNAAGLSSKMSSFKNVLNKLKPSIFFVQETKYKRSGMLDIGDYTIFELNRKLSGGGGLALGVISDLKPVLVREC